MRTSDAALAPLAPGTFSRHTAACILAAGQKCGASVEQYDLIVIGSGPAGRRAAIQAAKLGHSVLVIENRLRVGGVSGHTGTIPSKTLRETVLNLSGWRERGFYGLAYRKDIEGKDLGVRRCYRRARRIQQHGSR